jgi:hypothetical protein
MREALKPVGSLSPEKRRLLTVLLQEQGIAVSGTQRTPSIPQRNSSGPVPLSSHQERLWFLDQLHPGGANYNVPGIARLTGQLNVAALEQSLSEIVRRHESLRTTFAVQPDGLPVQVIGRARPLTLPVTDLTDLPELEREAEARRLATAEACCPFVLTRGPLFRASLLRLSEHEHVLVLNVHHIVADGWSIGVLTRELAALYEAFSQGYPSPLPELPIQYADFARWQRAWMQGEEMQTQLAYWKQHLSALLALQLSTDRPRPKVLSYRGRHRPVMLSKSLTEALRTLAQREGVSLFMTLLAAFKILLHHDTGQDDIVVGTAFANRNRSEWEQLIGFFVNTLPLRTNLKGNPSFRELLRRVREVTLGAYAHQDVPLGTLVKELQSKRDLSRSPLFQVEFTLLTPDHNPAVYGYGLGSTVRETLNLPGLTVTPWDVESGVARFDLAVFIWDLPEGLGGAIEYSTDLFEPATIARMVERFETLLGWVVAEPDARLSGLVRRLNEVERQQQISQEKSYKETVHQKLKSIKRRTKFQVPNSKFQTNSNG